MLLAVLDHTNGLVLSFTRGLDLSGTPQGAGGVGGLLFVGYRTASPTQHAVAYDGNGNVAALLNMSDGTESARYEYGPFGEAIRQTGPLARANPVRFSTQFADDVTGDLKYLFRDCDTEQGRWLSRDPIQETGGNNLYAIAGNDLLTKIDVRGLAGMVDTRQDYKPPPPEPAGSCKALSLELFADYAGFGNFTHLDSDAMIDVMASQEVQGFMASLKAAAKSRWICGKSGRIFRSDTDHADSFNPASIDMGIARMLDWAGTGNWHLIMAGECKWKCKPCKPCCGCVCTSSCVIKGSISKYYSFLYVPGGNKANIGSTVVLYPVNYLGETFIIDEPFTVPGGEIGTRPCN